MKKTTNGNQKHLTMSDRIYIEQALAERKNFRNIAAYLEKDPSTISKEVRKYKTVKAHYIFKSNECKNEKGCRKKNLCNEVYCSTRCAICKNIDCREVCKEYVSNTCEKLYKPPYVCNGCDDRHGVCKKIHYYYKARFAHVSYEKVLTDSRKGINLSPAELEELNDLISPLIKNGQPLGHIFRYHAEEIGCSRKTLYNYVNASLFSIGNIDLPRKVKYKPRKRRAKLSVREYAYRSGRTYKDFQKYMEENPEVNVVEMDTVKGTNESGKVMLTMLFRNCSLMLIFLIKLDNQTCVGEVFDNLTEELGLVLFRKTFPIVLTDNGSEFKNPWMLEDVYGEKRTKVFYCDPQASWQKARLEKNHEFIRYIIPKGKNLQMFTQSDMIKLMNHINSTARDSINGKTPFELASLLLEDQLLKSLGLKCISPDDILLKPVLLKK